MEWIRTACLAVLVLSFDVASAAGPLSFAATFPKPNGGGRNVTFTGTISGAQIAGQLSVDGQQLTVAASVAGDTVSGTFVRDGSFRAGTFSARKNGNELEGTDDLNGEAGRWSIPMSELPSAAQALWQP